MLPVITLFSIAIKCIGAVVVVSLLWMVINFAVNHVRFYKSVKGVPGPPGKPLIGNALELCVPADDIIRAFLDTLKPYRNEPVVVMWVGNYGGYFLQSGSAAEVIMKDPRQVNKSADYDIPEDYLKTGLLTSTREKWEKRRKMINHAFHYRILEGFITTFNEKAQVLCNKFEKLAGTGTFDLAPLVTLCSLDIICETTMGYSLNSQDNGELQYAKALHDLQDGYIYRAFRPWLRPNFVFNLTKHKTVERACLNIIQTLNREIIISRRALLEEEKKNMDKQVELEDGIMGKRKLAFLDLLLEANVDGKSLTDDDILEEVNICMHAGHDTTSSAMTFALFLLGLNQDIQKRVQEEIVNVLGDEDRPVTSSDLTQLKYLEAVIKETLRLYPSVPMTGRKLSVDANISGYRIPAGSSVYFPIILIHKDPKVFQDPEKFCPDRFYGETALKLSPYEYVPFSAGPRNCIGLKFAMMEMKIVLSRVLHKFNILTHQKTEDIKLVAAPVLQSYYGNIISVQKIVR